MASPSGTGVASLPNPGSASVNRARASAQSSCDLGEKAVPVPGQDLSGAVADLLGGGGRTVEQVAGSLVVAQVELGDAEVGQRPLDGVVQAGAGGDVDRLLEHAGGFRVAAELPQPPSEVVQDRREPPGVVELAEPRQRPPGRCGMAVSSSPVLSAVSMRTNPMTAGTPRVVRRRSELVLGLAQQRLRCVRGPRR